MYILTRHLQANYHHLKQIFEIENSPSCCSWPVRDISEHLKLYKYSINRMNIQDYSDTIDYVNKMVGCMIPRVNDTYTVFNYTYGYIFGTCTYVAPS